MTATSARLMLYSKAQEVLGVEEATVLMDMLTPGEMFEAWRSDTQAGFAQVRAQLEISETALHRRIDETNRRLDALELKVDRGFDAVDRRFAEMEAKFDKKFVEMEAKFDKKFVEMEAKFDMKFVEMEAKFDRKFAEMEAKFGKKFDTLENRIMTRMSRLILGVGIPFMLSNVAILVTLVART